MKKQDTWVLVWDTFIMLMGICLPVVFSWIFLKEFPVIGTRSIILNRICIGWFAAGTICYSIAYFSLIFGYPRSKTEYFRSWNGSILILSIGGFWVLYLLSLLLGPIGLIAYAISALRWVAGKLESRT